jgi:hypothetical protein
MLRLDELDRYIAGLGNVGQVQRRHLRTFARSILRKLPRATGITVDVLLTLRLPYAPKRQSSAINFFAKFLLRSGRWTESDLAAFERLTGLARGKTILRFQLPSIDGEIRGLAFRRIRSVLGLRMVPACLVLNLAPGELRRIERTDGPFPAPAQPALQLIEDLLARLPAVLPSWLHEWDHFSKPSAEIPFATPACPGCGSYLRVNGKERTRFRGAYWTFICAGCDGRYWTSTDGILHTVNSGLGWRKSVAERPICEKCGVECVITGSPGSSMKRHYFACPKCAQHYKVEDGKCLKTRLGRSPRPLPFMKDRPPCPKCGSIFLRLAAMPPWNRSYLFRCSKCDAGFKWSVRKHSLIQLPWKRFKRRDSRKTGKRTPLFTEAQRLHAEKHSWAQIAKQLVPEEYRTDRKGAAERLRKGVSYHLRVASQTR